MLVIKFFTGVILLFSASNRVEVSAEGSASVTDSVVKVVKEKKRRTC